MNATPNPERSLVGVIQECKQSCAQLQTYLATITARKTVVAASPVHLKEKSPTQLKDVQPKT